MTFACLGSLNGESYAHLGKKNAATSGVLANVSVTMGGEAVPVTLASAQPNFVGLDQVNIRLPRRLAGQGEVDVVLTVDGKAANQVRINLR